MTFILSYRAMYAALPFVLPFGPVGFVQQPLQQQHEGKWKYAGSYSPLHGIRTCLSETRLQAPIPFVGDVLEIGENQHQRSTVKHYSEPCSGTVPPVWVLLSLAILDHGPKHIHQKTDSFTTFQEKKRGCSLTPYRVNHSKDFIHCMAKEKKFCTLILNFFCNSYDYHVHLFLRLYAMSQHLFTVKIIFGWDLPHVPITIWAW